MDHDDTTTADGLFSHPIEHRSHQANEPGTNRRPAYDNLFREPDLPPAPDTDEPDEPAEPPQQVRSNRSPRADSARRHRPGTRK